MIQIPGYTIFEEIGEGTKSLVYRGYGEVEKKDVIIKVSSFADVIVNEFRHEYEVSRNLDIPGVVKIYRIEEFSGGTALVMEDFGGVSLKKIIIAQLVDIKTFLKLAIKLTGILGSLHECNIIHGDIKPSNIIVNLNTDEVKISDLSHSFIFEVAGMGAAGVSGGTLAYMSPEQTGRINKSIDYRTDFYSLGITLYEMLACEPPFTASDPVELIYSHIAKTPLPPSSKSFAIPPVISDIIMKLLSKNPEDRYHSAFAIKHDLEECLSQLENRGTINDFTIARKDIPEWLNIPSKIYGREAEKKALGAVYERITRGSTEFVLISGHAGIGKTALIQEVFNMIPQRQAFFIEGKYEQFKKDIPYSGIIQAFRGLVKMLLTERKDKLEEWKEKLLNAFGINGQVVVNVIPEIELIVGNLPIIPAMGPLEARNIFINVFQELFKVCSSPEHPLVIFLDDLQHADPASLSLLETIITREGISNFLFIGSYRDDEVDDTHPLIAMMRNIRTAGIVTTVLSLQPLTIDEVNNLVSDMLSVEKERSLELSKSIIEKTAGNAFFVIVFIKELYRDRIIRYNSTKGAWEWELGQVEAIGYTDNVIDLLIERLNSMPDDVRKILSLASCIGTTFNPTLLMVLLETSLETTFKLIVESSKDGFIIPVRDSKISREGYYNEKTSGFRFAHDRILEASRSLLSILDIQHNHLKIGRILLNETAPEMLDDKIFEIINHYHKGIELVKDETEKHKLAELSLLAGKKAKSTTAYQAACDYITAGMGLLPEKAWETDYEFSFDMHRELSECEYLAGNHQKAEELFDLTLQHSRTNLDKAEIYNIRMVLCANIGKFTDNIRLCIEALRLFDIYLPDVNDREATLKYTDELIKEYRAKLGDTKIEELMHLPIMDDPEKRICMKLISSSLSTAYVSNALFFAVASLKGMNMTLQYGMTEYSIFLFAAFGMLMGMKFSDYISGYDFTIVALKLKTMMNSRQTKSNVPFIFGNFINHWRSHISKNLDYLREAYNGGIEIGDYVYSSFAAMSIARVSLSYGHDNLEALLKEIENSLSFFKKIKNYPALERQELNHHTVLNLLGLTKSKYSLNSDSFDESAHLEKMTSINYGTGIALFHLYKAQTLYLYHDYQEAFRYSNEALKNIHFILNMMQESDCVLFSSLIITALYPAATDEDKVSYLATLQKNQERMALWKEHCPENFTCRYLLVEAEIGRITGDYIQTARLYEQAAISAKENNFIFMTALCYECAALFYLATGIEGVAGIYMNRAVRYYSTWGARGKVKDLEENYPGIIEQYRERGGPASEKKKAADDGIDSYGSSHGTITEMMDITSIVKASQAISGEIVFKNLIGTLMRILIENAGAQTGFLVIDDVEPIIVKAESDPREGSGITVRKLPGDSPEEYPGSVISYVRRTGEEMLLNDAMTEGVFRDDPYIQRRKPVSILCIPITEQTKITGILYLENRIMKNVFTPERIQVLGLLSSQAAISIKNSLNYEEITRTKDELQQSKEKLQESFEEYYNLFANIQDMFYRTDNKGIITLVSPSVEKLLGYTSGEVVNMNIRDLYRYPEERNIFLELISEKGYVENFETRLVRKDGSTIWIATNSHYVRDRDGTVVGIEGMLRDITERMNIMDRLNKSLEEKDILLKELYHRTKNNMQVICSMLNLKVSHINDPAYRLIFNEIITKIQTMAVVHQKLYESNDLSNINLHEYISSISDIIMKNTELVQGKLAVRLSVDSIPISIDTAMPLGLIINELMTNSIKHAFPGDRAGEISIAMSGIGDEIRLEYRDNGIGLPDGFDPSTTQTIGMKIIDGIARMQLNGDIKIFNDSGFFCQINFNTNLYRKRY